MQEDHAYLLLFDCFPSKHMNGSLKTYCRPFFVLQLQNNNIGAKVLILPPKPIKLIGFLIKLQTR